MHQHIEGGAGVVEGVMNHLIEQAPASDAMKIVRALRVSQEVREDFSREVLALWRRWLRHLNGPYRRSVSKQTRGHTDRARRLPFS